MEASTTSSGTVSFSMSRKLSSARSRTIQWARRHESQMLCRQSRTASQRDAILHVIQIRGDECRDRVAGQRVIGRHSFRTPANGKSNPGLRPPLRKPRRRPPVGEFREFFAHLLIALGRADFDQALEALKIRGGGFTDADLDAFSEADVTDPHKHDQRPGPTRGSRELSVSRES